MRDYSKTDEDWGEKASKDEADYRPGNVNEHCGICTMFRPPHTCTAVQGRVSFGGLCDYFKRK